MKFAKRMLMVAGALALAGILGAAMAPKAAHGLVAAMVQVANTAANPAMTQDTSKQVSQIVELSCGAVLPPPGDSCTQLLPGAPLPSTAYTVPAGQTLVVTNVEFQPVDDGEIATFEIGYEIHPGTLVGKSWSAIGGSTTEFSLGPGFGIPAGNSINVLTQFNTVGFRAIIRGYLTSN